MKVNACGMNLLSHAREINFLLDSVFANFRLAKITSNTVHTNGVSSFQWLIGGFHCSVIIVQANLIVKVHPCPQNQDCVDVPPPALLHPFVTGIVS